jgi:hypothetical protein
MALTSHAPCYNLASEGLAMPEWLEAGIGIFVGAAAILLLVKYRDREWLGKWRSHI